MGFRPQRFELHHNSPNSSIKFDVFIPRTTHHWKNTSFRISSPERKILFCYFLRCAEERAEIPKTENFLLVKFIGRETGAGSEEQGHFSPCALFIKGIIFALRAKSYVRRKFLLNQSFHESQDLVGVDSSQEALSTFRDYPEASTGTLTCD